jgi:hypothetical protein
MKRKNYLSSNGNKVFIVETILAWVKLSIDSLYSFLNDGLVRFIEVLGVLLDPLSNGWVEVT